MLKYMHGSHHCTCKNTVEASVVHKVGSCWQSRENLVTNTVQYAGSGRIRTESVSGV